MKRAHTGAPLPQRAAAPSSAAPAQRASLPSAPAPSRAPPQLPGARPGAAAAAAPAARQAPPAAAPAASAAALDIDDLFAAIPKKKAARLAASAEEGARAAAAAAGARAEAAAAAARLAALERAGRAANHLGGGDSPVALRFDAKLGVKVYSLESLKIGAGNGDTADCPFDCNCCF
jgi:hypothetical protein